MGESRARRDAQPGPQLRARRQADEAGIEGLVIPEARAQVEHHYGLAGADGVTWEMRGRARGRWRSS